MILLIALHFTAFTASKNARWSPKLCWKSEIFLQKRRLRQNPRAYSLLFSSRFLGFALIENGIDHFFQAWIES